MRFATAALCLLASVGCGRVGYASHPRDASAHDSGGRDGALGDSGTGGDGGSGDASILDSAFVDAGVVDGATDAGGADGSVPSLGPLAPVRIFSDSFFARGASIVWDGRGYGLAYTSPGGTIDFVRVDTDGGMLSSPVSASEGASGNQPDVTFAGDEYGVAWRRVNNARFRPIDSTGALTGTVYDSTGGFGSAGNPIRVSATSSQYALTFGTTIVGTNSLQYTLIDKGTGVAAPESVSLADNRGDVRPRWTGTEWLTVTRGFTSGELRVRTFLSAWNGDVRLDDSADLSTSARLVDTAAGFAAVWIDTVGGERLLRFRPIGRSGTPTGPPVTVMTTSTTGTSVAAVKRTPRGIEVWQERGAFYDRYVLDDSGGVIDALTIDEPTTDTLSFEALGPEFTFVYTNVDGLWMQRIKSL